MEMRRPWERAQRIVVCKSKLRPVSGSRARTCMSSVSGSVIVWLSKPYTGAQDGPATVALTKVAKIRGCGSRRCLLGVEHRHVIVVLRSGRLRPAQAHHANAPPQRPHADDVNGFSMVFTPCSRPFQGACANSGSQSSAWPPAAPMVVAKLNYPYLSFIGVGLFPQRIFPASLLSLDRTWPTISDTTDTTVSAGPADAVAMTPSTDSSRCWRVFEDRASGTRKGL